MQLILKGKRFFASDIGKHIFWAQLFCDTKYHQKFQVPKLEGGYWTLKGYFGGWFSPTSAVSILLIA